MKKQNPVTKIIFKVVVYAALIIMTISILVPVAWVFMASFKRNAEFIEREQIPGLFLSSFSIRTTLLHL